MPVDGQALPAVHCAQPASADTPVLGLNVPTGQDTHVVLPRFTEYVPRGHKVGAEVPAAGHTLPLGHAAQLANSDLPVLGLKVPIGQGKQAKLLVMLL